MTTLIVSETVLARVAALPEVRCPDCNRLLLRGFMTGEILCGKCGRLVKRQDTVK